MFVIARPCFGPTAVLLLHWTSPTLAVVTGFSRCTNLSCVSRQAGIAMEVLHSGPMVHLHLFGEIKTDLGRPMGLMEGRGGRYSGGAVAGMYWRNRCGWHWINTLSYNCLHDAQVLLWSLRVKGRRCVCPLHTARCSSTTLAWWRHSSTLPALLD